jgi:hypothetical protein
MYEQEDIWLNAFAALHSRAKPVVDKKGRILKYAPDPDPKPLVDLLRSDTPMPRGARDALAELLSPGDPAYLGCRLVLEEFRTFNRDQKTDQNGSLRFGKNEGQGRRGSSGGSRDRTP